MQSLTSATFRRRMIPAALVGASALLLSACGSDNAGAAATIGDTSISVSQLQEQVVAVLDAQGQVANVADNALTATTLSRMITMDLVDLLAEREGVAITQGQLDQATYQVVSQSGGQEEFDAMLAQQGLVPEQAEDVIRMQMQAQEIGIKLDPNGAVEAQGAAVRDAVVALSEDLEVTINPRYGSWDPLGLNVGPFLDDVATFPTASAE